MMFLAEAAPLLPDPNSTGSVGWLILTLAGLLGIVKLGMDLWKDHFKEKPVPAETYATKEELEEIKEDVEKIETKIDEGIRALTAENSRRAASIHGRVDKVSEGLAAVKTSAELTHNGQMLLGQKVDNLIMELRRDRK